MSQERPTARDVVGRLAVGGKVGVAVTFSKMFRTES
jgi:hypothetical protein